MPSRSDPPEARTAKPSPRGHAAEFGVIAAKGIARVDPLLRKIADADMPQAAKETLAQLGRVIDQLDSQLAEVNQRLAVQHKANPVSQRLAAIPGVGPLTALTVAMKVDAAQFESARHFAAWLGLTPKERSTGSRQSLGGISQAGNERLRQLLVVDAMAVIRHAKPGSKTASPWLLQLLERRPRKVAAVPRSKRATVGDGKRSTRRTRHPVWCKGISMLHPCLGLAQRDPSGPAVMQPH